LVYKKHQKDLQQLRDQFQYDRYREKYEDAINRLGIAERKLKEAQSVIDQARQVADLHRTAQELLGNIVIVAQPRTH